MIRRRVVAAVSALVLLGLGMGLVGGAVAFTRTAYGREKMRALLMAELRHVIHGRLYIGHISGTMLTNVSVDSLELIDPDGLVFFASGPLSARYDPRDLLDRRILIQQITVQHPYVHLIEHRNGVWNFQRVFPSPGAVPSRARTRGLGDYIVFDSVDLRGAAVHYSSPWGPDDTLHPVQRDSQVRAELRDSLDPVRRWPEGLMHTLSFTGVNFRGPYVRLADPDSVGLGFLIDHLDVDISNPPFRFRSAQGVVHIVGDTAFANLAHVDMPGSRTHGGGKVWWGSHRPLAYALHFVGDTVSLADVAWVYPTLPTAGGGHAVIDIHSHPNPHVIDYRLTNLDLHTTQSRVLGSMTFTVSGPTLAVHDVSLQAEPLDLEFIKALGAKPFPYDWRGHFTGFVRGPGGPLPKFRVDTVDLTLHDAHVSDAVSRAAGSGELNILDPSETIFHHFHLTLHQLDLRTPEFVNHELGHLQGTVSGTAMLDSTWDDVRMSNVDLVHRDGTGAVSRLTGRAHITLGDNATTYDVDAQVTPIAFSTLAQSYPQIPLRGSYSGSLTMQGTLNQLDVSTVLTGDGGTLAFEGSGNFYGPVYAANGTLTLQHANLRAMTENEQWPATDLFGHFDGDLRGDTTLATLTGGVNVSIDSSTVHGMAIQSLRAPLTFAGGRVHMDSLRVASALGLLRAPSGGGLGLASDASDSLPLTLDMDSLGALRRFLVRDSTAPDTLTGFVRLAATVKGRLDSVALDGTMTGQELRTGDTRARTATSSFSVTDVPHRPQVLARLALDGVTFGHGGLIDSVMTTFSSVPHALAVDRLALYLPTNVWRLQDAAHVRFDSVELTIDPVTLRGTTGGSVTVRGVVPNAGYGDALVRFAADSMPLADLGGLLQAKQPWQGMGTLDGTITGPRVSPIVRIDGMLTSAQFGTVHLEAVRLEGAYSQRRFQLHTDVLAHGDTIVHALVSVPVDFSLVPVRQRVLDDSLIGNVHTDSTDFGALATIVPSLSNPKGHLAVDVNIGGTVHHPTFNGGIHLSDAEAGFPELGVRFVQMSADLNLAGDSLAIRNVAGTSITQDRQGHAALHGWVTFADLADPRFDLTLTASNFHVLDRPRLADLEVTVPSGSPVHLVGSETHSVLTGAVEVVRGSIFIPDITQKHVINLDDPEFYNVVDTSLEVNRHLLPEAPPRLVQGLTLDNVRITMGQDVWLKSSEAHINLSTAEGPLTVTTTSSARDSTKTLALTGTLVAERGDYRLNLGLVQRNFLVDQPGTLRFGGESDLNPELDISAIHTVRQPQSNTADVAPELSIRVHLGGTLEHPTVTLSNADSLQQLSQSDLVSYLVTGQQSFDVANGTNTSTLTSVFLPTLGSALGSQLSGGLLDYVQVQAGGYSQFASSATQSTLLGTLSGSRIGAGKQIGDRTFVSADLGVCQLAGGGGATAPTFTDQIGVRVEHQLTSHFSIAGASEPATTALYCGTAISRSFVATPRQWGLDLFHTWQF